MILFWIGSKKCVEWHFSHKICHTSPPPYKDVHFQTIWFINLWKINDALVWPWKWRSNKMMKKNLKTNSLFLFPNRTRIQTHIKKIVFCWIEKKQTTKLYYKRIWKILIIWNSHKSSSKYKTNRTSSFFVYYI